MYFWKTDNLVAELKEGSVSEENFKNYYLGTSILTLVSFYLALLESPTNLSAMAIEAIGSIGATIFGLKYAFNANGGNSGTQFINKALSISFPLLIKVTVVGFILGVVLVFFEELGVKSLQIEWMLSLSIIFIQIVFFWRLSVHIKNTNV